MLHLLIDNAVIFINNHDLLVIVVPSGALGGPGVSK